MKRFDVILLFIMFMLSSTVLFQNCSEMKSSAGSGSDGNAAAGSDDNRVVPEFLVNRTLEFDNKIVNESNLQTNWSVGGEDIFYYETDYQATYESTLVTVTGNANSQAVLKVVADDCDAEKVLTYDESLTLSNFYANYIPTTEVRVLAMDEVTTPGCAFPRLGLDTKGLLPDNSPATDFDIYFTTPECSPAGEFFVTDRDGNDPAQALDDVRTFFNAQIDLVCGF